jgi:SAM-dependent methyltransferase
MEKELLKPINLSAYADATLDALVSGPGKPMDGTIFLEYIQQVQGPVLELGCGIGRYTIPLAELGIDLTAIDLSAPSLAYARQKAGDLPIRWVEADIRDFKLHQRYDFIFARGGVFDFLLTLQDQEAMLACVQEHLVDGGQYMFDICHLPPSQMVNELDEVDWFSLTHPNGRQIYVSGKDIYDYSLQIRTQICYERWDSPDGELVRTPWELTLRYSFPQEIETLLHYNGFMIVAKYADYDGIPATAENIAEVFICEKR